MNYYTECVLDGEHSGLMAYVTKTGKYVTYNKTCTLFTNYEFLISRIRDMGLTPYEYTISFSLFDREFVVPLTGIVRKKENGIWLVYPPLNDKFAMIEVRESHTDTVTHIGYISYAKSYEEGKQTKQHLLEKQKELFRIIKFSISALATYPHYGLSVGIDQLENYCVSLVGTTAKIHIQTNSDIIDFNIARGDAGLRRLPFRKDADKYGTLYLYATVDINENRNTYERIYDTIDAIMCYMKYHFSDLEPKYEELDFGGYINIVREEIQVEWQ